MTKKIFTINNKIISILLLALLINSSIVALYIVSVKAATPTRIMPLGDSITRGTVPASNPYGYRLKLYTDLTNAGFDIDFVGSQSSGGPTFDADHEGYPGYRADQIASSVYNWLTANPADIVLLHIGTNDIAGGNENVNEVEQILDEIDRYETVHSMEIDVVLARIILRSDDSALNETTKDFNNAVANMAQARINSGDNIVLVDMENALLYPADMQADGEHPNLTGYQKMSDVWYNALINLIENNPNQPPVANAGGPYSGEEGEQISFDGSGSSDPDGTIVSWLWDFGDGETSNDQSPTHAYVQDGTYTVTLTVTDDDSATDEDESSAVISDARPQADFTGSPTSGPEPLTVTFTDQSTSYDGINSWRWNFGDSEISNDQNPTHVYEDEGTFTVSLTISDSDGDSDTETKTDYISILSDLPPVADAGGPYSGSEGTPISFDGSGSSDPDGTIVSWSWDFGDGETSTGPNPTHVYDQDGPYIVTLTVTDDGEETDTDTASVEVADADPIADFTAEPVYGPEPLTVTFTDTSISSDGIVSWHWVFEDGQTSDDPHPTYTFSEGKYHIRLTVEESDGDRDSITKQNFITVTSNLPPVANAGGPYSGSEGTPISFDGSGSSDPDGTIVSWLWDFGDGETSTNQNPTHAYDHDGTYTVTLTVTDDESAIDDDTISVAVNDKDPQPEFSASPASGTKPLNVTFTDQSISYDGISSWLWVFGDGETSNDQNPTHVYEDEGKFAVSLTVEESDGDSTTETKINYITVSTDQPPPPPPPPPPSNSPPVANFEVQSSTKPGINEEIFFIDLSSDNDGTIASWSWNFGDGNTSTTQNATHRYQAIGNYTITLTVKDDDEATNTKTKQITIYDVNPPITTTNYDGLWHNSNIAVTLTATDDYSGVAETNYIINGGTTQQLSATGQPQINTEGTSTLEYWSIDKAGNEETHHMLDIRIDKTNPTADAGQDLTITEDTIMNFNGSNSTDNIAISKYKWILFDGTLQTLDGANAQYIFHTPGVFTANLTVTDAALNSAIDTVKITVIDITNPIANAGDDQVLHQKDVVTFDGSNSTDNVGVASYSWDFTDLTPQHLEGKNPTYAFESAGTHEVKLTVSDAQGNSATDTVLITAIDSAWPAANAGPDQIVEEDTWVYFDGSASSDNVGIVDYVWTFTDGTQQTLYGVNASYVFENPEIYVVTLTVSDAEGHSSNDTITIIVRDTTAPNIEVEDYTAVIENSPVNFDASSSYDNAGIVNYNWAFGDGTIENTTIPTAMHIYTEPGVYNVELTVTDVTGNVNGTIISIVVNRDTDGDLIADHLDPDDDNDGIPDEWEIRYDLDPLDPSDASGDSDGDGISNLNEYKNESDPIAYNFSTSTLSIILVVAVILSMVSFGIFYSRKLQGRIK